jgi:ABC-type antimicrobial peptide transport system permease subunit
MVIRQGIVLTLIGVIFGGCAALLGTRLLGSFLFGVKPLDLIPFKGSPLLLNLVGRFSAWVPATRATKVNPIAALRIE